MTVPRVMHVVLTLCPGGAERLVIDMARWQQRRLTDVSICCLDEPGVWAAQAEASGIPVEALHRRPGFHPSLGARVAELAQRQQATVIHAHQYSPFVYGALALWRSPKARLVVTEHGRTADDRPTLKRRVANSILGRSPHAIVAVSDALRRTLVEEGYPAHRVSVIRNGIEPGGEGSEADRGLARRLMNLPLGTPVVGTVARFDPVKNLGSLMAAFKAVRERIAGARLVLVGDGPERPRLERLAAELGVSDGVSWLGLRDDARQLLPGFDVFVNSSFGEGVSVTLLEAMAASRPVVATRVGGTPEVVTDGETGLLVPSADDGALAGALVELLHDPARRDRMGSRGRVRVVTAFSFDRMMASYMPLYGMAGAEQAHVRH